MCVHIDVLKMVTTTKNGAIEDPAKAMGSKVGYWGKMPYPGGIKSGSYQGTVQLYSTMIQHFTLPQVGRKRVFAFRLLDFNEN